RVPSGLILLLAGFSTPGATEEPALRLCGREFVRTLVALCGGTRWTRGPLPGTGTPKIIGSVPAGASPLPALFQPTSLGASMATAPPAWPPPGPAGSCCSRGCTQQELLPFC
uniref:Insulin-like 3 n=1 Tax=Anas platyrhynchos platyrhynchos TaxID=8840 RepID=A0A493TY66_ANAPP